MGINIVDQVDNAVQINHVLVSVSNKQGLDQLIPNLVEINPSIRIFSTGGTYARIEEILGKRAGDVLTPVSRYTGQPETQGGLVKTLDFKIYLGLLTETHNPSHQEDLRRTGAVPIDMVVVNLYPFRETVAKPRVTPEEARGNIDIGGPCMIRASAKNFLRVAPVVDPEDYPEIIEKVRKCDGCLELRDRYRLAVKAFRHTAGYDRAIAEYLIATNFASVKECYRL